jgi:hypothetical protein
VLRSEVVHRSPPSLRRSTAHSRVVLPTAVAANLSRVCGRERHRDGQVDTNEGGTWTGSVKPRQPPGYGDPASRQGPSSYAQFMTFGRVAAPARMNPTLEEVQLTERRGSGIAAPQRSTSANPPARP